MQEGSELAVIALKFLLTFVSAFIFGVERQKSHKPIGFGTFIFVSVGSCGLAITALSITMDNPSESPIPLLSAIVTGIGFLGAGALIKTTDRIFGFTTAASIWFFAIFGLVIGVGEYVIAFIMYLLLWVVVSYDRFLERRGIGSYQRKLSVCADGAVGEEEVRDALGVDKSKLINMHIDKRNAKLYVTYIVEGEKEDVDKIPGLLLEKEWFESCRIE